MRLASWLPDRALDRAASRWPGDPETFEGFWSDAHYWKWARHAQHSPTVRRRVQAALDQLEREGKIVRDGSGYRLPDKR